MIRAALALLAACSASAASHAPTDCFYDCKPAAPAAPCFYDCPPSPPPPDKHPPQPPAVLGKLDPIGERVQLLREAADQLEKAMTALQQGNRRLAEQLFSTAELLAPDVLEPLAPAFREGAPPRVTTPPVQADPKAAPQPAVVGSSEAEDEVDKVPAPKIEFGSLTGAMQIDGKRTTGAFGLVTLEPIGATWKPRTPKPHVLEQRDRAFRPHLMAISTGSTVAFPNYDPYFHNVFSTSPIAAFDLGIYKNTQAREYTFTKEGIVRIGCNLHANMSAYIAVVSAPAYVVTDENGQFAFERLAPGRYTLHAWSERSTAPITQTVTIKVGRNEVTVGVTGDAASGPQPDKFGTKRPPGRDRP